MNDTDMNVAEEEVTTTETDATEETEATGAEVETNDEEAAA